MQLWFAGDVDASVLSMVGLLVLLAPSGVWVLFGAIHMPPPGVAMIIPDDLFY